MKTAIVTFVRAYNHGAVLQCYALQKKLQQMGIENDVLDYYPSYFRKTYHLESLQIRCFPFRPLKSWIKYLPLARIRDRRVSKFESFIKTNITLSDEQYSTKEDLEKSSLTYTAYITGSDQVWTFIWNEFDPVFFLDFIPANQAKKLSYAASFGFIDCPIHLRKEYQMRLSGYDLYSVREESGKALLENLIGCSSSVCCDPTLLLNSIEWAQISKPMRKKAPYIFVYYINEPEKMLRYGVELGQKKNMDVISATSIASPEDLLGRKSAKHYVSHKGACAPDEFLTLVMNADYVLTDSFHGTVFSLIFQKPFLVLTDFENGKQNIRAKELLLKLKIQSRAISYDDLTTMDSPMNWDSVRYQLQKIQCESLEYIRIMKNKIGAESN